MDPSRSKSGGGNDSERKFVSQILWLSLAGGMASFTRVSGIEIAKVRFDLRSLEKKEGFLTVLSTNSFLSDMAAESSSRFDCCPTPKRSF